MLRILILGGTGFIGPHMVEAARSRGHTVTLFNRGKTRADLFPDIEKLRGDRDGNLKALEGRSWDAVIDDAAFLPRIVTVSAELLGKSAKQYVFISTVSVFAEPAQAGADESAPLLPPPSPPSEDVKTHYGALKALCEAAAEKAMPGRTTSIRPGLIVGPGDPTDRFTYWPARFDRGGDVLCPGDGKDPVQFIDAGDLATFTIGALERTHVGVYNAVRPATTMGDLVEACRRAAGTPSRPVWASAVFLGQEQVAPWSDMPVWVGTGSDAGFAQVSATKAIGSGLTFRPLADTVKDTLAWWRAEPALRRSNVRAGLPPEREAALLAAWRLQSER